MQDTRGDLVCRILPERAFMLFLGSVKKNTEIVISAASNPVSTGDVRVIQRTLAALARSPQDPDVVAETERVLQVNAYLGLTDAAALTNRLRSAFRNS